MVKNDMMNVVHEEAIKTPTGMSCFAPSARHIDCMNKAQSLLYLGLKKSSGPKSPRKSSAIDGDAEFVFVSESAGMTSALFVSTSGEDVHLNPGGTSEQKVSVQG